LLVLPPQNTMRPAVLSKLKQLITDGGIVVGPAPTSSPSLRNYPVCDEQVNQLAQELWQNCDGVQSKSISVGKGKIYNGVELTEIFNDLNIIPDIGDIDAKSFPWIHRSSPDAEIYYISNQKDQTAEFSPSFRVTGLQPELWNPVTNEQRNLSDFKIENGKTTVPLEFAPRQSYFIIFRKKVATAIKDPINFVRKKTIGELKGSWTVYFDKKWGAPDSVVFDTLEDWTKRPETGIKFYSGTARYCKVFDAPAYNKKSAIYLNLGTFNALAVVKVNGQSLGLVWAEPRIVDISRYLKKKNNLLEIEVTNTWNNRLVGDAALPPDKRLTNATTSPDANAPLMPSGLIGPVTLQIEDPEPYVQKINIAVDKQVITKPEKALVAMTTLTPNAKIHYTTDGTIPTEKSALYANPIELREYSIVRAKAFEKGKQASEISQLEVEAFDPKVNGLNYEYFEGEWSKIPDFDKLISVKKGKSIGLDIATIKGREDHFGIKFQGSVSIPTSGNYTFYLLSDDGSKLYIDGKLIIDNDGFHGELEKAGSIELTQGKHVIRVDYFDNINGEALKLFYGS
ncbi:MAG: glycosyl hydrolase, partial [Bacteroidota bacterium]|nr:glycosyl hydrolase [Bacteroidota bacterium]